MNIRPATLVILLAALNTIGCDPPRMSSDQRQSQQQEAILQEGTSAVGMPAIRNFRERRLLKTILELRDQNDLSTYTYLWSDVHGRWVFFCNSVGYGVPYATQFTSPQKTVHVFEHGDIVVPQADPNGLFSPASAEGTWIMCRDPKGHDVKPVYVEPRVIVSPFELASTDVAPPTEVATTTIVAKKK